MLILLFILIYVKRPIHYKQEKVPTKVVDSIPLQDEDPDEDTKESLNHVKNLIEMYEKIIETNQYGRKRSKLVTRI